MKKNRKDNKVRSLNNPNQMKNMVEIPMYGPNQGLKPIEYEALNKLVELEDELRERCMDFLKKSNPDEYNASYMDSVIERIIIEAIKYIKMQRNDHINLISVTLDKVHRGDLIKCRRRLENLQHDKEINQRKLEKYRKIYHSGTSLEEGE